MKISIILFGTSLFAASAVNAAPITIKFSGETRACAGGVKDATHTISIRAQVGNALPVTFRLSNKNAFILEGNGKISREGRTIRPDGNGKCALEVRGGSRPTAPFLIALQEGKEIGRVQLNFAPSSLYRRFADPTDFNSEADDGMLFSRDGNTGKIYLKFRRSRTKGDVNGNWEPVAGHRLLVSVAQVDATATLGKIITNPKQIERYGRVFNFKNPKAKKCIVTTRADGTAQFGVQFFNFDEDATLQIDTKDLTELSATKDYVSPSTPKPQQIPNYGKQNPKPQWFARPTDLKIRLLWHDAEAKIKGVSKWKWSDIDGTKRSTERLLNIKTYVGEDGYEGVAYNPTFSPDTSRILMSLEIPGQTFDGNHDSIIADLANGGSYTWREYTFGASEKWSSDGKRVAFVDGSLDNMLSGPIAPPLVLCTRETKIPAIYVTPTPVPANMVLATAALFNVETALVTDDGLERDSLAWTKNGDLLAVTDTKGQRILRFKNGAGTGKVWKTNAYSPMPSPDGMHIAFRGPEPDPDGQSRDRARAINVADDSGANARTLTRISDGNTEVFFTPEGQSAIVTEISGDDESQENKTPAQVFIVISEYNLKSGTRRTIAALKSLKLWGYQDKFGFSMLGLSKDGKYLLLGNQELKAQKNAGYKTVANALHAVRLRDGKLIPIAVFNSEFAVAPLE